MANASHTHPLIHCTIPISHYSLPTNERECPICLEPYALPYSNMPHPGIAPGTHEYAVRVKSQWPGSKCRHVFGSRCLESHFKSLGPWSTKCPLCKEEWFPEQEVDKIDSEDEDGSEDDESEEESSAGETVPGTRNDGRARAQAQARARVGVRIQIPQNLVVRVTHGTTRRQQVANLEEGPSNQAATEQAGLPRRLVANMQGLTNRGKLQRSVDFLEWMLLTGEVDDGDLQTSISVQDVEIAIEKMWRQLELNGTERDRRNRGAQWSSA